MTMMPRRVEKLLNAEHVLYRTIAHRRELTSQEVASAAHVPGRKLAKVVALRNAQGAWILAVVPATHRVDLEALTFWTDQSGLRLATETEMVRRFPDCEPGAVPPFEQLHDVPVLLDDSFGQIDDLYFEDGTHERLVEMRVADFMRVSAPEVLHFSVQAHGH